MNFPYRPWPAFLWLVLVNSLLAYGPLPFQAKLLLGLLCLFLPLYVTLRTIPPAPAKEAPLFRREFWGAPSRGLWIFLGLAAFGLRFIGLEETSVWPMWDDANYSYYAIGLSEKWHWQLFFGSEKYMPIYVWLQGLYYHLVGPSSQTLWVYPVLFSVPLLPLAYLALRRFTSRSFSFVFFLLLALSFWPLFIIRFSTDVGLNLLWEFGGFFLLASYLKTIGRKGSQQNLFAAGLGAWVGLGWYVSKFWVLTLPVFAFLFFYLTLRERRKDWRPLVLFAAVATLCLLPMAYFISHGDYGGYIWRRFLQMNAQWRHTQVLATLSYWTSFFWGCVDKTYFNFDARQGGLFNPLLASAFFIGVIELFRDRRKGFFYPGLLLFALAILPGSLTLPIELNRMAAAMPFFLFVMTWGILKLMEPLKKKAKWALMAGLLLSLTLDLYQLYGPYHDWALPGRHSLISKSPERYRAFRILDSQNLQKGPGLVLTDLIPDVFDQSLLVTTYPFNAARNPALSPNDAKWAGILIPEGWVKELTKVFPDSQYFSLSVDLARFDHSIGLLVLPLDYLNRPILFRWMLANRVYQDSYGNIPYHLAEPNYERVMADLSVRQPDLTADPFLSWCYWTKVADYLSYGKDDGAFYQAASKVMESGHPTSDLELALAHRFYGAGDFARTKKHLELAVKLNPAVTIPPGTWERLDLLIQKTAPIVSPKPSKHSGKR